ncbi:uncharacterized protein LOC128228984 [Mya arenaria]|uniref:uncharacterized protein LOC128228983 n=1 Tax=Mya arenaria TaxID=6604 RepID=UPI0022E24E29|nr:uncharacterized protein LOC128228983 [Mya arenaria]XP_052796543.1 uncharacterized protein LOC128228984 [Mya arenaria]
MRVLLLFTVAVLGRALALPSWLSFSDTDNPSQEITANTEITAAEARECMQKAAWGRCEFYDCLEQKFACGPNGYTNKISKHFCTKIDADFDSFDTFGKRWLNQTSICLVSYMRTIYEQAATSCLDIKNAGIEAILACNEGVVDGQDFCDFLDTNGAAYNNLMGLQEVQLMLGLRDVRVFRSMIEDAVTCGVGSLADRARSVGASISGFFSRVSSYMFS